MHAFGKASLLLPLMMLAAMANAQDSSTPFDSVQIDNKKCNLVEQGSHNEKVVWEGKSQIGMCFVVIDRPDFEKKYSHCALSGVLGSKGADFTCEFGYYNREKTKLVFTSGGDALCEFICVKPDTR